MFIKRGLKKTYNQIRKNKIIFLSLIILQAIFLTILSYTLYNYISEIFNQFQQVITPLQQTNPNTAGQKQLLDNAQEIYQNYQNMIQNIKTIISYTLQLIIGANLINWSLTHYITNKKENIITRWITSIFKALIFLTPIGIINYYILKNNISLSTQLSQAKTPLTITAIITLIGIYFTIISISQKNTNPITSTIKAIKNGILKIHKNLLVLAIPTLLLYLIGLVSYQRIYNPTSLIIPIILTLTFIITIVISRIFIINTIQTINKD